MIAGKGLGRLAVLLLAVVNAWRRQRRCEGSVDAIRLQLGQDHGAQKRRQPFSANLGVSLMRLRGDRRFDEGQPFVKELGDSLLRRLDV